MDKKSIQHVTPAIRESMSRANRTRDPELQLKLFCEIVKQEPAFVNARTKLRELERRKALGDNFISKLIGQLLSSFKLPKIKALAGKDPLAAMAACEDALAITLDNPVVLASLADIAESQGAMFIAVEARSLIHDFHPKSEGNLRELARCLQANNQAREALKIMQELAAMHPNDLGVQSEVRAALALASMEKGKWEEEGTAQEKTVDAKAAVAQQLLDGTIHDADQAKLLVDKLLADLAEKDSIDTRRKLADAYMVMEDYDNVILQLEKVVETLGTCDPFLDKAIETAVVARFDKTIRELQQNPTAYAEPEKQIAEFTAQRDAYKLARAEERAKRFPNDAQLNFELAALLFSRGQYTDSIPYFQIARRSPQRRVECMVYLGRCFSENHQYDMAVEQLEGALAEMDVMDKTKLETLYSLANTLENAGAEEKAIERFKEIYQYQANFRDVAKRIEAYYERHKNA